MNTLITNEDADYLEKQGDISLILSGMMSLLQDSDHKVEEILKQQWFLRMWKTVTGKNKATAKEVEKNHDKLSVYMTQAMEILFERNVMTQQMVNNLGIQLNVLYQEHNDLKEMMGALVEKLNEKIVSIDHFHMLSEEIRLHMYAGDKPIVAICKIVTQLDERTVNDPRKMEILQQSLLQENILTENPISLESLFMDLLTCTTEEAGQFILGLGAVREQYLPSLFLEFLEMYYYASDMERRLKSKGKFCAHYLDVKQFENDASLTSLEVYQNSVDSLKESIMLLQVPTDASSDTPTDHAPHPTSTTAEKLAPLADFVLENGRLLKYLGCGPAVSIPEDVLEIGEEAFAFNESLLSVTIPNSVKTMGRGAFYGCKFLTSVVIPNSITTIGEGAFYGCGALTEVAIPDSVLYMGKQVFYQCENLTTVTLSNVLTTIEAETFYFCSALKTVQIPDTVQAIELGAFSCCHALTALVVPDSVIKLGGDAFSACIALTTVVIPSSVTQIEKKAFYGCKSLSSVVFKGDSTTIDIHPTAFKKTLCKEVVKNRNK